MNFLASLDPGQHFLDVALSTLVQVTVLVAVLAPLARLLWRNRADARHTLWLGALGWLFLSPAVSVLAGRLAPGLWTLSLPQADSQRDLARDAPDMAADPFPGAIETTPEVTPPRVTAGDARTAAVRREPERSVESPSRFPQPVTPVVILIWLIGVVIGLARILLDWKRLAALSHGEHPLDSEIHRETLAQVREALGCANLPPIVILPAASEPAAVGLFRPRVVLPEGLAEGLTLDKTSHETYFTGVVIEKTPTGERPIADARVHKIGVGGGISMSASDTQGRFRMLNTPGEHFLYTCAPQGLAGFASLPGSPDGMKVVVSPSTTVSGRVVDSNGKTLASHRVGVALASGSDSFRGSLCFAFQIKTDENGRFRVGGVPAGSVGEFSAYHKVVAGRETPRTVVRFEVPDLEPVQVPDLVVPAEKPVHK